MKEVTGNLWAFHNKGYWVVITTNGTVKKNGEAVMGRGVALQAAQKFPQIPSHLGQMITGTGMFGRPPPKSGNICRAFWGLGIIAFPVKHNWWERANLGLIEESCKGLLGVVKDIERTKKTGQRGPQWAWENQWPDEIYMVRPGCGNGGLDWKDVKPILEKYLDTQFIVVEG